MGLFIAGVIGDRIRVEDNNIGEVSGRQFAALMKFKITRGL